MNFEARRTEGRDGRLLLAFHGAGAGSAQLHGAAEQFFPEARIVSPAGSVIENEIRRHFARNDGGLDDLDDLAARRYAMAAFVAAETARTAAQEVIGIGYSNGADMRAALSAAAPDLCHTLALLHPQLAPPDAPQPGLAATRVLISAGQRDPHRPAERTQALVDWYAAQKADVTLAWHPGGHEIPESEVVALADFFC